jgi:hypothetical protein
MDSIINLASRILFQFRWAFMSPERRYVYLWNRANPDYRYYKYQ